MHIYVIYLCSLGVEGWGGGGGGGGGVGVEGMQKSGETCKINFLVFVLCTLSDDALYLY